MKSSTPDDTGYYLNYYDKSDFIQKGQYLAECIPRKLSTLKIIGVISPRNKGSVLSDHSHRQLFKPVSIQYMSKYQ